MQASTFLGCKPVYRHLGHSGLFRMNWDAFGLCQKQLFFLGIHLGDILLLTLGKLNVLNVCYFRTHSETYPWDCERRHRVVHSLICSPNPYTEGVRHSHVTCIIFSCADTTNDGRSRFLVPSVVYTGGSNLKTAIFVTATKCRGSRLSPIKTRHY